ncbi:hypothetical protein Nmel_017510 [Mimus melanotis]
MGAAGSKSQQIREKLNSSKPTTASCPLFLALCSPHGMGCIAQKMKKQTGNHPADSELMEFCPANNTRLFSREDEAVSCAVEFLTKNLSV